ncbi:uncharacterized protein LOC121833727 [Ixodes scapularis]|uniref:uncharacterized protein LOC121833727 n=1 Tax=Ixodes scapularis TaxID=6945 RepID=UPI001C38DE5B|nr:uncharacterized protein LOC121833727 [Ixodes scapularis]
MIESMALHWAVTDKLSIILRGGPRFAVFTNNFSVAYFAQKGAMNRRLARWMLGLAEYTFDVVHTPGKLNEAADTLSRQGEIDTMPGDNLKTVAAGQGLAFYAVVAGDHSHLSDLQARDAEFQSFISQANSGNSAYKIKNGIPTKKKKKSTEHGHFVKRIVVPATLRGSVMTIVQDNGGHMGYEKTKELIQRKFW